MYPIKDFEKVRMHGWDLHEAFKDVGWHCSCGSKTTGAMLTTLCCTHQVKTAIEIGIANGFTTMCLAGGLLANEVIDPMLVSIDFNENACGYSRSITNGKPLKHIVACEDTTKMDLPKIMGGVKADLCYVDGDHSYLGEKNDILKCLEVSHDRTIFVIHDYNVGLPEVMQAVHEALPRDVWQYFIIYEQGTTGDIQSVMAQKRLY